MKEEHTVSLCMVVKNEEKWLRHCLTKAKPYVSEIIIVDTGSTDDSVAIAESFGANVIHHQFHHHFSWARNEGLDQAKGDWILVLDADEEMPPYNKEKYRTLLNTKQYLGYYLPIKNYYGPRQDDKNYTTDQVCRLFKNRPNIRFRGRIHEEVSQSIIEHYTSKVIGFCDLTISHYGYLDEEIVHKHKVRRNISLLIEAIKENPLDMYLLYALSTEYFQLGDYKRAVDSYLPLLNKISHKEGYYSDLLFKIVVCFYELKQYNKALSYIYEGKKLFPDFVGILELEALIHFENDDYYKATKVLEESLNIGDVTSKYSLSSGSGGYYSHYLLGRTKERQGLWEQAIKCYEDAIKEYPAFIEAIRRWGQLVFLLYKEDSLCIAKINHLFTKIPLNSFVALLSEALREVRPNIGLIMLDQINTELPILVKLKVMCLFQNHHVKEALAIIEENDYLIQDHLLLYSAYKVTEQTEKATQLLEIITSSASHQERVHILLNLQVFDPIILKWTKNYYDEHKACLLTSLAPLIQKAPLDFIEEIFSFGVDHQDDLTYQDLLFTIWCGLKTSRFDETYFLIHKAREKAPMRIEHALSMGFWLDHYLGVGEYKDNKLSLLLVH